VLIFINIASGSDKRTLAYPCPLYDLTITHFLQQTQRMFNLLLGKLSRSAFAKVWPLTSMDFPLLCPLHNKISLKLGETTKDGQNQPARWGVLNNSHVKHMHLYSAVKQLPYTRKPVNSASSKSIKFRYDKRVSTL